MSATKKDRSVQEVPTSDRDEVERLSVIAKFSEMNHAVERCVWDLGLADYKKHKQLYEQLQKTLKAPHAILLAVAMYYLNRLDGFNRAHADGIYTLGEAICFAGQMAAAYQVQDGENQAEEQGEEDTNRIVN